MAQLFDASLIFDDGGMLDDVGDIKLEHQQQHILQHQQLSPVGASTSGCNNVMIGIGGPSGSGNVSSAAASGTSGVFSFSRASSIGSVHAPSYSSASSTHNTDDEDSDSTPMQTVNRDKRREAHTHAEQKRRDAIKKGYDELQAIVPTCHQPADGGSAQKLSKATILQRSIDYAQFLLAQKKKQEEELEKLRKEVLALKIMKSNYEQIVKAHQNNPLHGQNQVTEEEKFKVFQQIMDALFESFNESISVSGFSELSASVFRWLEEYCKPQTLRELTLQVLHQSDPSANRQ